MTAMTAEAAGADLLDELRDLLDRHDTAATLDDVREIADELTSVLRRTRGRLGRLARKVAQPTPAVKEPLKPAEPKPAERAAPPPPEPRPDRTPATPTPAPAVTTRVVAAGVPRGRRVLAVAALVWSVVTAGASAARAAVRRMVALFASDREEECIVCAPDDYCRPVMPLPRPEDAPPLSATKRSPLDIAAGLQTRKAQFYASYQDTVLQWELGTRAHLGLEVVER